MKLFTDRDLREYVAAEILTALEADKHSHRRELEEKDWHIRRVEAQLKDATDDKDRFRGAYKRALKKLGVYRVKLGQATRQLEAAGLAGDSEPNEDGSPKLDTVQGIFDAAMSAIPMMDDMSQNHVRAYIERELRARGAKAGPDILTEVIAGDPVDQE